jgi:hypothetical protein
MVGDYALRYALVHPAVSRVRVIGRRTLGMSHPKLDESYIGTSRIALHSQSRSRVRTRRSIASARKPGRWRTQCFAR